ncbi:MAG: hemolysin family protein [Cyanobacteria bacterium P01_A01_bin.37]
MSLPHSSDVFLRLSSVVLLIAINAFFVAAEFSIVSVRRSRINHLASEGDEQAKTVQTLQRGIERLLSTTQFGITLSSLALGWIGEATIARPLAEWLMSLPLSRPLSLTLSHAIAVPIAFFLIAYLQIVLGELCPKSVALIYAEQLARWLGTPSLAIARFFHPFIWVLNQSTRLLLRLGNVQYQHNATYDQLTPEELQLIISTSTESPGLEADERELLTNVFEFGDVTAGEVMVPRTSIVALSSEATVRQLLQEMSHTEHSRYPVLGDSLDDIRGIISFKSLAAPLEKGELDLDSPISPWLNPAKFVSEHVLLSELLHLMQRSAQPIVIVLDEFGGTAGLVVLQDIAAEIIGEAHELNDDDIISIQTLDDQTALVQAQVNIEDVNEELNYNIPISDDYQTLGGFLIDQLQKIPKPGDMLVFGDLEMTVISAENTRLHQIQVRHIDNLSKMVGENQEDGASTHQSIQNPYSTQQSPSD